MIYAALYNNQCLMLLYSSTITILTFVCVCVCDSSQPKAIFQKDVESEDKKDDDIEPAWKKKKV